MSSQRMDSLTNMALITCVLSDHLLWQDVNSKAQHQYTISLVKHSTLLEITSPPSIAYTGSLLDMSR